MSAKFAANLDNLYEMLGLIRDKAVEIGFDQDACSKIELALEEAIVNIMNYAYPDQEGVIEIEFERTKKPGMVIVLKDTGVPFDPVEYKKKAKPLETIGGYGIFFIKQLMDEIVYERSENKNVLKITKFISD